MSYDSLVSAFYRNLILETTFLTQKLLIFYTTVSV